MDFKYAIFDMDGTLVDSMATWRHVEIDVIEKIYNVIFSVEEKDYLEYMTYSKFLKEVSKLKNISIDYDIISDESYAMITDKYLNGEFKTKPYAKEFLAYLKKHNIGTAVATATPKSLCLPFLKKIGLYDYIDFIYTTVDDAKKSKSVSSLVYDMALEALGGTKEETIVFEDVLKCIETCKTNGYRVIAIHDKYQKYTKNEILNITECFIDSYKELID